MTEESNPEKYPFGSPSWEMDRILGCKYEDYYDASLDDVLKAIIKSADCIWTELRAIRDELEKRR
jgi:hypothetical protein